MVSELLKQCSYMCRNVKNNNRSHFGSSGVGPWARRVNSSASHRRVKQGESRADDSEKNDREEDEHKDHRESDGEDHRESDGEDDQEDCNGNGKEDYDAGCRVDLHKEDHDEDSRRARGHR